MTTPRDMSVDGGPTGPGMVERVARAIFERNAVLGGLAHPSWEIQGAITQALYKDAARAAIEAMLEPTEAMIVAHTGRSRSSIPGSGSHLTDEALNAWRAMIDAALQENSQ